MTAFQRRCSRALTSDSHSTTHLYPVCLHRASADALREPQVTPDLAYFDGDVQDGVGARELQQGEDRVDEALATVAGEVDSFLYDGR